MKRFFLLVSLIVAGQTSSADIIETEVTIRELHNGLYKFFQ